MKLVDLVERVFSHLERGGVGGGGGRVAQTCTSSFLFFGWPQLLSGTVVQWAQWESCTCTVAQSGTVASTCTISFSLVFMDAPPSLIPIISDCTFSMLSQDPGGIGFQQKLNKLS